MATECGWCGQPAPDAVSYAEGWWHPQCLERLQAVMERSEHSSMRRLPYHRDPPVCGTLRGYQDHMRRGEKPCAKCKAAVAKLQRQGVRVPRIDFSTPTGNKLVEVRQGYGLTPPPLGLEDARERRVDS